MTARDAEVIVVGGGPAGAATAFFLARAGIDVLLLDRATFPRDKPCAEYLSPQASRILSEMGALAPIEGAGAAHLAGMRVRAPNGLVIHGEFASTHGFRGFRDSGLALRRLVLDQILLDRARAVGARIEEGAPVRDVLRDARGVVEGVVVHSTNGAVERRAALVIGADGLRSVVGRRLGLTRVGRWPRRIALVAHFRGVEGMGDCGEMHVDAGGYTGLADVGNGVTNLAVVIPARRAREIGGEPDRYLAGWLADRPHLHSRFRHAEPVTGARATGPFNTSARRAWAPGAALVGDAADFFDPFTGEGIYAGLRGGELLATYAFEAVRGGSAPKRDVALAAYDRCRRNEFAGKWHVERAIALAVAFPPLLNRAARVLSARREMADLLIGVTGDFVPAREVLRPSFILRMMFGAGPGAPTVTPSRSTTPPNGPHLTTPSP